MISFKYRFHGHGSLKYVYRNGKVVRGQYLNIKYINNPKRDNFRASVVVSKKVSKSAVTRNKIRRKLYEIIRINSDKITSPFDIVLIIQNEKILDTTTTELNKLLIQHFKEAGMIL